MLCKVHALRLSQEEVYSYFVSNQEIFIPPLSDRVNLKEYSAKLVAYSTHFCVFTGKELTGFAAGYFNHPKREMSFLSTLSVVKEFQNKGIGSELLRTVINYGTSKGFDELRLIVYDANTDAVKLYTRTGFVETGRLLDKTEMVLRLKK